MVQTYRGQAESWEKAFTDIKEEMITTQNQLSERLNKLEDSFNLERKAYKAEIKRERGKIWVWGILFAGAGFAIGGR